VRAVEDKGEEDTLACPETGGLFSGAGTTEADFLAGAAERESSVSSRLLSFFFDLTGMFELRMDKDERGDKGIAATMASSTVGGTLGMALEISSSRSMESGLIMDASL